VPYIKQDEPLKLECQHFLECIAQGTVPVTNGRLGLEVVKILEASSESLRQQGAAVNLGQVAPWNNGHSNGYSNGHSNGHVNGNGNGNSLAGLAVPATNQSLVAA
jgi:hypothetical protein